MKTLRVIFMYVFVPPSFEMNIMKRINKNKPPKFTKSYKHYDQK